MEEDSVCFKLSWKGGCNNYNKIKGRLYIFCFPMKLKKGERRIRRRRRRKGMKQKDKCEGNMGTSHVSCVLFTWKLIFSSVQSLSRVRLFATPWTAARQASLSITNSWSLPKPMSIESVMPSNHLILCRPLLFLPSIFPSIRVFSNGSALRIRWPKYWSFSFNISPSSEHLGLISFRTDWLDLLAV